MTYRISHAAADQRVAVPTDTAGQPFARRGWRSDRYNEILRGLGMMAAALPIVVGLVATARIHWSNGFTSPAVRVAGMSFTPWVAIATIAGGVLALLVAVAPTRDPKLVLGAIYACGGLAIMIAQPTIDHITIVYRFGVMTFLVGLVLVATGLLLRTPRTMVLHDEPVA